MCTFGLVSQIYMKKQSTVDFFVFVVRQMFLHFDIIYMHTHSPANFDIQTPARTSLTVNLRVRMVTFCPKLRSYFSVISKVSTGFNVASELNVIA